MSSCLDDTGSAATMFVVCRTAAYTVMTCPMTKCKPWTVNCQFQAASRDALLCLISGAVVQDADGVHRENRLLLSSSQASTFAPPILLTTATNPTPGPASFPGKASFNCTLHSSVAALRGGMCNMPSSYTMLRRLTQLPAAA